MTKQSPIPLPKVAVGQPGWLDLVHRQVTSLRYGVVQIVVHDGHVTQIDKTERLRLDNRAPTPAQNRPPTPSPSEPPEPDIS
jgi:hypothetical protein